jgi:hypothetical protein
MDTTEQQPGGDEPVETQPLAPDADDAETRGEPDVEPTLPEPVDADKNRPHQGPLDDDEDARFLRAEDPRRQEVEQRRGERFSDQPDDEGAGSDAAEDEGETADGGTSAADEDAESESGGGEQQETS